MPRSRRAGEAGGLDGCEQACMIAVSGERCSKPSPHGAPMSKPPSDHTAKESWRPYAANHGKAKAAFNQAGDRTAKAAQADRPTSNEGRAPESIKRHAPAMNLDMPGGGTVREGLARDRLSKEAADFKKQQAMEKVAAKKMEKNEGITHNKSKSQDKGRE